LPTQIVNYEYIGTYVKQRKYTNTTNDVVYTTDYDNLGRLETSYTYKDAATDVDIVKINYSFESNSRNISKMTYDHRTSDPNVSFTYDDLDRLTAVTYGIDSTTESFTIDDLGNRSSVTLRDAPYNDAKLKDGKLTMALPSKSVIALEIDMLRKGMKW